MNARTFIFVLVHASICAGPTAARECHIGRQKHELRTRPRPRADRPRSAERTVTSGAFLLLLPAWRRRRRSTGARVRRTRPQVATPEDLPEDAYGGSLPAFASAGVAPAPTVPARGAQVLPSLGGVRHRRAPAMSRRAAAVVVLACCFVASTAWPSWLRLPRREKRDRKVSRVLENFQRGEYYGALNVSPKASPQQLKKACAPPGSAAPRPRRRFDPFARAQLPLDGDGRPSGQDG